MVMYGVPLEMINFMETICCLIDSFDRKNQCARLPAILVRSHFFEEAIRYAYSLAISGTPANLVAKVKRREGVFFGKFR